MVADSARRKFDPVAYDVVLERQNVAWLLAFQGFEATLRHRERVVRELPLARLYAPLEHREIDYPAKGEQVGVGEPEVAPERGTHLPESDAGRWRRPDGGEHGIAGGSARCRDQGAHFFKGELPRQRPLGLAPVGR